MDSFQKGFDLYLEKKALFRYIKPVGSFIWNRMLWPKALSKVKTSKLLDIIQKNPGTAAAKAAQEELQTLIRHAPTTIGSTARTAGALTALSLGWNKLTGQGKNQELESFKKGLETGDYNPEQVKRLQQTQKNVQDLIGKSKANQFWNQPLTGLKDIPHVGEYLTPRNLGFGLGAIALMNMLRK